MFKFRAYLGSYIYRFTRRLLIIIINHYQNLFKEPVDLESVEQAGDRLLKPLSIIKPLAFHFTIPCSNKTAFGPLVYPSPFLFSSFKGDFHLLDMWLSMGLGGGIFKTILHDKRSGNLRPRLQEISISGKKGLLNALGLPGPGITSFLDSLQTFPWIGRDRPLGISIGGNTITEYLETINDTHKALKTYPGQWFLELNISCPNTEEGQMISKNPALLEGLLTQARKKTDLFIGIKVSPDMSNTLLKTIGEITESHLNTYINAGNTQYRSCSSLGLSKGAISIGGGGSSGPHLFERTLEMTHIFSNFNIPILATGGISKPIHVKRLKESGAQLFGLATALVQDPYQIITLNRHYRGN